jgi:4-phospho-D-threonate 3-dehydrogenase / 4-phospho-D-erythronate 3-dehydrogenase
VVDGVNDQPLVAVSMGDGAGIGPEIVVKALLRDEVRAVCRPLVIGDAERLCRAADFCGVDVDVKRVDDPAATTFAPGTIEIVDLALLPDDLPFGAVHAAAGEAAYQYVVRAVDLARAGKVDAICTAPLNKEALRAAGHDFPGHTELLAHLFDVDEVSMMLSTPELNVVHVTTHVGLIEAIDRIEPGIVYRTIRRGMLAVATAGTPRPRIAVCGINPHAGENGLFGRGEEATKVVPAVERARGEGMEVMGPLAADTVFFRARRGDFDLVVAMYHDQGHGPVKVLGLDAGVNVTVGLPVPRTSVDHGTAFDIAGTGVADERSMVEALRRAAFLSARQSSAAS